MHYSSPSPLRPFLAVPSKTRGHENGDTIAGLDGFLELVGHVVAPIPTKSIRRERELVIVLEVSTTEITSGIAAQDLGNLVPLGASELFPQLSGKPIGPRVLFQMSNETNWIYRIF